MDGWMDGWDGWMNGWMDDCHEWNNYGQLINVLEVIPGAREVSKQGIILGFFCEWEIKRRGRGLTTNTKANAVCNRNCTFI